MKSNRFFNFFLVLLALTGAHSAFALTTLRQIEVSKNDDVQIHLDQEISAADIKTEFFRDIVQISLNNVSVYPAKIFSVDNPHYTKIFAYQYTPKLTRFRLTVKGDAEKYKDALKINRDGKTVVIKFLSGTVVQSNNQDQVVVKAANPVRPAEPSGAAPADKKAVDEKELLERVLLKDKKTKTTDIAQKLASKKEDINPMRSFMWLGVILMMFIGAAFAIKKLKDKGLEKRISGFLGKMSIGTKGSKKKMIEIVANHHLGPKKSIAVVKINGRQLVVGITNDSINLISEMNSEDADFMISEDEALPSKKMGAGAEFGGIMQKAVHSPKVSVREQIRRRVEGMKDL